MGVNAIMKKIKLNWLIVGLVAVLLTACGNNSETEATDAQVEEQHFYTEVKPGKYRHFKGNEYEVIGTALHSETGEKLVVYKALYNDGGLWVRPYDMFKEIIEKDGKKIQRFTPID